VSEDKTLTEGEAIQLIALALIINPAFFGMIATLIIIYDTFKCIKNKVESWIWKQS
jgi:hypothetical protein